MKKYLIIFGISVFFGCKNEKKEIIEDEYENLYPTATTFFQPISSLDLEEPDANKVALGKHLFFDTRLSGEGNISCNSCHNLNTFGVDNMRFSPGDAPGTVGGRNSPTVFHASLHKMQFWDGRAEDVEEQAGGPILNPLEHNIKDEQQLVNRLKEVEMYQELFSKAYGDDDPITFSNLTNAIGAFERTLIPGSRFDKYLEGDQEALSKQEKKGLNAFIASGCITCHSGPALGGQMLQKFGLFHDYWKFTESEEVDLGLFDISERESEKYFFKVPGLRNVVKTAPYFHDGSVADLDTAVKIMGKLQRNVDLTDEEVEDIVAFFGSLTSDIPEEVKKSPFKS
ncbi:cytochrome-c peroxidase [Aequorivita viscosa]|uniref:Cytochrome c peroxidase n=1 Tax=Aequorivita viscosa TaxID=797419 RepID=A0A1M6GG27_9FLAO|nr:cytochrome-c peroxidase [Aequorivita viscosa]SDW84822.1 cytochrome c peroxidase [Aequorivita viscosa]SHJ08924.1 cytochrome c peroxidase [Aequorivita viscosa]